MKISHGRWGILLAIVPVLGVVVAGFAAAQATRPTQGKGAPRENNVDHYLARCVALENDNAIMLAKFAQTRAEGKDVISFAETVEKDHEKFARDLENFAGKIGARHNRDKRENEERNPRTGTSGKANARENRRESTPPQGQPGQAAPAQPGTPQSSQFGNVFMQIKEELADECLYSAQRELQEKKGTKFDSCYLGMQLAAHMQMIDALKVFEQHATPELARVFHQERETAQKHFDQAKELIKDHDGVRTARRDGDSQE